jgi:hypothetical protein
MTHRSLGTAALAAAVACSGQHPKSAPGPARNVRVLAATDTQLVPLAVAAAMSLDRSGTPEPSFQGVIIDGYQVRSATDAVLRATQLARFTDTPVPTGIGSRSGGTLGPSTAKVYALTFFRVTPDSGYVAATTPVGGGNSLPSCIMLARSGETWRVVGARPVSRVERCGQ